MLALIGQTIGSAASAASSPAAGAFGGLVLIACSLLPACAVTDAVPGGLIRIESSTEFELSETATHELVRTILESERCELVEHEGGLVVRGKYGTPWNHHQLGVLIEACGDGRTRVTFVAERDTDLLEPLCVRIAEGRKLLAAGLPLPRTAPSRNPDSID
jgi:hypothetical protein